MMIMATAIPIDPMLPHPYSVREVGKETPDTFTLTLEPENADNGSTFQPGQFSMLWVFGVGELPISISGDPALHDRLVYTVRSVGQATHSLVNRRLGDGVGVRGPFGAGWPVEAARGKDIIVVAGGIGLAPLRPLIYHVLQNRKDYGRLVILYGGRSPRDLLVSQGTGDVGSQAATLKCWSRSTMGAWAGEGTSALSRLCSNTPGCSRLVQLRWSAVRRS